MQWLRNFPFAPPVLSAALLIATLPPLGQWYLVFVALIPMYRYVHDARNYPYVFGAGVLFGLMLSGYVSAVTLFGFSWIEETYLFSQFVRLLMVPIVIVMGLVSGLIWMLFAYLQAWTRSPIERVLLFSSTFPLLELAVGAALLGLNYGSLVYAGMQVPAVRAFASLGGALLITFMVTFWNAALAEAIEGIIARRSLAHRFAPLALWAGVVSVWWLTFTTIHAPEDDTGTRSITIALVQDQTTDEDAAFGKMSNDGFSFPVLEEHLDDPRLEEADVIAYPFSPFVGVLSESVDNQRFNKEVIGADYAHFGDWAAEHVPESATLAIWHSTLAGGKYFNEFTYWSDGALTGVYRKRDLFPFFDYTPEWAQDMGLYTTPFDVTPGTSTPPLSMNGLALGGLVCSEIATPGPLRERAATMDIALSLGSEAMFQHALAREYSLMNAQLRAVEFNRPVVRANRTGPSGIFDARGASVLHYASGASGVALGTLRAATSPSETVYAQYENTPLLIGIGVFFGYILLRGRRRTEEVR